MIEAIKITVEEHGCSRAESTQSSDFAGLKARRFHR
jgi:hypothetical protein